MGRELKRVRGNKWVVRSTVSSPHSPITPKFDTIEEVREHLVKHGTEADPPWEPGAADAFIEEKWAPSMMMLGGVLLTPRETAFWKK